MKEDECYFFSVDYPSGEDILVLKEVGKNQIPFLFSSKKASRIGLNYGVEKIKVIFYVEECGIKKNTGGYGYYY